MTGDPPADVPKWPVVPRYATDLFAGTAEYYDKYRVPYPDAMLNDIMKRAGTTGEGRLLDLACGTGELALPLAPYFREVWGVDQEPDMIEQARSKAARVGASNVRWIVSRAEDVDAPEDSVELVVIGNAFHRLDRSRVARFALGWLAPGRCIAIAGSSSLGTGVEDWQALARRVLDRDRPSEQPASKGSPGAAPGAAERMLSHQEVLTEAGFEEVEQYDFPTPHVWTLDSFIGYLYSTSFASKGSLGSSAESIEEELRRELLAYDPSGTYPETIAFYYILGRVPA
jgi:SAM-dependent methyltransferase